MIWLLAQSETESLGNPFHWSPGWPERSFATTSHPSEGLTPPSMITAWTISPPERKQRNSVNWFCFTREKLFILALLIPTLHPRIDSLCIILSINILQKQGVTCWRCGKEALGKYNLHTSCLSTHDPKATCLCRQGNGEGRLCKGWTNVDVVWLNIQVKAVTLREWGCCSLCDSAQMTWIFAWELGLLKTYRKNITRWTKRVT